jgi:hypothetical protein
MNKNRYENRIQSIKRAQLMPVFYHVDGFKVYSHLDFETTERFLDKIRSQGLLPSAANARKYASLHRMEFDGLTWSVAIMHLDNTIFIDKIVQARFNPRKE